MRRSVASGHEISHSSNGWYEVERSFARLIVESAIVKANRTLAVEVFIRFWQVGSAWRLSSSKSLKLDENQNDGKINMCNKE
jgi:hypothetical protein